MKSRKAPEAGPHDWLDKHIQAQAQHYGMTVEQKACLFDEAAEYGELIEQGLVDEPSQG